MFETWSIKKIIGIFGFCLLIIASAQIYLYISGYPDYYYFILSFFALFFALIIFHSVNIKLKRIKKKK